ncbi:unnamed protein product [Penicillium bialowiezense]
MEHLTELIDHTTLSDRREDLEQLLFSPKKNSAITEDILDNIPRYLFRVVSPGSRGTADERWVRSGSASQHKSSSKEDIFSNLNHMKRKVTAHMLNSHLRWWPDYGADDDFVSWTSSLLFAIQYIYYQDGRNWNVSDLTDIHLYVIDTEQFPRGTFIRDMDLINIFCGVDVSLEEFKKLRLRDGARYYFGEYLSQGALKIENKCQIISADIMFERHRLRRIQPEFAEIDSAIASGNHGWVKEVIRLREAIWRTQMIPTYSFVEMRDRLEAIEEIIDTVGNHWKFPIAIYLASLIGSESSIDGCETAFDNIFFSYFRSAPFRGGSSIYLNEEHVNQKKQENFRPSNFVVAPHKMPELEHVKRLVREIHNHSQLMIALGTINEAEDKICKLLAQSTLQAGEGSLFVSDENNVLGRAGRGLLSKLASVQKLCGSLALDISLEEEA